MLTNIVNTSLSTGVMPDVLKIAAVTPTLKKLIIRLVFVADITRALTG